MADTIEIRRKAKPSDYEPYDTNGKTMYKLEWQERLLPGVLAPTPEEGASEYNEYLEDLPEINRDRSNNQNIIDCYSWVMTDILSTDKKMVASALLNGYERKPIDGNFIGLSTNASKYMSILFFNRGDIKATLSSERIESLKSKLEQLL